MSESEQCLSCCPSPSPCFSWLELTCGTSWQLSPQLISWPLSHTTQAAHNLIQDTFSLSTVLTLTRYLKTCQPKRKHLSTGLSNKIIIPIHYADFMISFIRWGVPHLNKLLWLSVVVGHKALLGRFFIPRHGVNGVVLSFLNIITTLHSRVAICKFDFSHGNYSLDMLVRRNTTTSHFWTRMLMSVKCGHIRIHRNWMQIGFN